MVMVNAKECVMVFRERDREAEEGVWGMDYINGKGRRIGWYSLYPEPLSFQSSLAGYLKDDP